VTWLKTAAANMRCPLCKRHAISGEEYNVECDKQPHKTDPYGNPNTKYKTSFTCSKCKATFYKMKDFFDHLDMFNHSTRSKFACRKCHEMFPDRNSFMGHL
jgi:hypothetical protein